MRDVSEILLRESPWVFDKEVVKIFDEHVRMSVPFYDEVHRMISELSDLFIIKKGTVCDLGTATGHAIRNLYEYHKSKDLTFYGIDSSLPMLMKARSRLQNVPRVNLVNSGIEEFNFPKSHLVLAIYTLQFLGAGIRLPVVSRIYDSLTDKGGFILVEKVKPEDTDFRKAFVCFHEKMKERNGFSKKEIAAKRKSLIGVLEPLTIRENLRILCEAGFKNIELFFCWHNFAGIVARK